MASKADDKTAKPGAGGPPSQLLPAYVQGLLSIFSSGWPAWLAGLALLASTTGAIYAIQRWGRTPTPQTTVNTLDQSQSVLAIAYSGTGALMAVRKDADGGFKSVSWIGAGTPTYTSAAGTPTYTSKELSTGAFGEHVAAGFVGNLPVLVFNHGDFLELVCQDRETGWPNGDRNESCLGAVRDNRLGDYKYMVTVFDFVAKADGFAFLPPSTIAIQSGSQPLRFVSSPSPAQRIPPPDQRFLAPCSIASSGGAALFACVNGGLWLIPHTSNMKFAEDFSPRAQQQSSRPGRVTALALSPKGEPAVATEDGRVWVWFNTGKPGSDQWSGADFSTPGIVQALAFTGSMLVAGGGFRGVYVLDLQATHPQWQQINSDVAGIKAISVRQLGPTGGEFAFTSLSGISSVTLVQVLKLNSVAYQITFAWLAFWVPLLLRPVFSMRAETVRARRDAQIRADVERSLERVATADAAQRLHAPEPPAELVESCLQGECVAFIGAGMSAGLGLPTWRALIQAMLGDFTRKGVIDSKTGEGLQEALNEGRTDLVADGIVSNLSGRENLIHEFLRANFIQPRKLITPAHDYLRRLKLSAVLTTNFDDVLETTFNQSTEDVATHQDGEKLLTALSRRQFFILKLYGSLERPGSVLLAPFQYVEAMARNVVFSRFMETLFSSRTLLFLGASLDGIEAYLSGIRFPTALPKKHYALVAVEGAWRVKADLLERRFGIQVLPFTPQAGFGEVEKFLRDLAEEIETRSAAAKQPQRETARLKTVVLDNIGPFDHLQLELDAKWTILLGDNGVGKSTILKAIAVGIVGGDAADYAGRLVQAGKSHATITLITEDKKTYITTIKKVGSRAFVECSPSRALEATNWLALGFPPLRTFTWAGVKDLPSRGLQRASSDDLLPLVTGDVDPRLDVLKAWIIDLDYRDAKSRAFLSESESQSAFASLLSEFFEVIRKLTPGFRLGEVKIDADKKEVLVEDGRLRIEAVSQGIQSLLGWVGILMQRLYDFYGSNVFSPEAPSSLMKKSAIILMDEIDAHMHPKWQQRIVSTLKDLFPNCQIIATTHSPLIVVGMERNEVLRVRRVDDEREPRPRIVVEPPAHSLRGWAADQVLTGALFDLETVMDPKFYDSVASYTELAAKDSRTSEEEQKLTKLAGELNIVRPSPKQREEARLAFQMIETALESQLQQIPAEKRAKIRAEAKVQIEENITGSRRPG
jgi:energy-coupling factor transporter ATP-binding protein EcfA2